jgi:chromosome segregation ATPase
MAKKVPPPLKIRMTAELRRKIQRVAEQNGQTLNAEIVFRLEKSFQIDREAIELESLKARLARVETQLDRHSRKRVDFDDRYPGYIEAVDELRLQKEEFERQRDEIETKIAEVEEKQRRLKQP